LANPAIKPAVTKTVLLFLAGGMWFAVGLLLLNYACHWLSAASYRTAWISAGTGVLLALAVHHCAFLRIVDKNIARILPMADKKCLFAFITWRSYLIIVLMVAMGTLLRHSALPKHYLAVVYIGMGLALMLSSLRYFRVFIGEVKNRNK